MCVVLTDSETDADVDSVLLVEVERDIVAVMLLLSDMVAVAVMGSVSDWERVRDSVVEMETVGVVGRVSDADMLMLTL